MPLEAHLRQAAKSGVNLDELFGERTVEPPSELRFVWLQFLELNRGRGSSGWWPNVISYVEISAFCKLYNMRLAAWEIDVIKQLDSLWMEAYGLRPTKPDNQE